jgi:dienelactone hydrolase
MPELVSAVVAYYPMTSFIQDPSSFVASIQVPTLMLVGVNDTYKNCCRIEIARKLADAARVSADPSVFEVHEYPFAYHGWTIRSSREWRADDAADSFRRTLVHLQKNMVPK